MELCENKVIIKQFKVITNQCSGMEESHISGYGLVGDGASKFLLAFGEINY